jgi:ABC-2 type transport system ATP-binding protein
VFGEDPWDNPRVRARVGTVYERANFPSHHKVLGYLERTCRIHGVEESRATDVLEMVALQEASTRSIGALSAGMLQKFAIAHALINQPEFVVADEPTSNLDPKARHDLLDLILRLNKEDGTTFLVSSHVLPELSSICSSVAVISRGKVWAQGGFEELSAKYRAEVSRISTDRPEAIAEEVRGLKYVTRVDVDARGLSVHLAQGKSQELYEDVLEIARELGAHILGMESSVSSIEELFRRAVEGEEGG